MANSTVKLVVCAIWVGVGAVVSVIAAGAFPAAGSRQVSSGGKMCACEPFFSSLFRAFPPCGISGGCSGPPVPASSRNKAWEAGMKLVGWAFLAAWGLVAVFAAAPAAASPVGEPGYVLTNTYPDTGGRAPVAHGG